MNDDCRNHHHHCYDCRNHHHRAVHIHHLHGCRNHHRHAFHIHHHRCHGCRNHHHCHGCRNHHRHAFHIHHHRYHDCRNHHHRYHDCRNHHHRYHDYLKRRDGYIADDHHIHDEVYSLVYNHLSHLPECDHILADNHDFDDHRHNCLGDNSLVDYRAFVENPFAHSDYRHRKVCDSRNDLDIQSERHVDYFRIHQKVFPHQRVYHGNDRASLVFSPFLDYLILIPRHHRLWMIYSHQRNRLVFVIRNSR